MPSHWRIFAMRLAIGESTSTALRHGATVASDDEAVRGNVPLQEASGGIFRGNSSCNTDSGSTIVG
jgi:hypothetical protein